MVQIKDFLPKLTLGEAVAHGNLTMFPLLGEAGGNPDYLTLDEALQAHSAHVTELDSAASVPELKFVNDGDKSVLLLDGEELVGAKQNRVLNLTILAPAHTELIIPVSCVEAGRWSVRSAEFVSSPRTQHATGRRMKMQSVSESMCLLGERRSDQGAVWTDIASKIRRMGTESHTDALSDVFERHQIHLDDFVEALKPVEDQTGAVFAVNGKVFGMDVFDHPVTLSKLLPKLVSSYALDAIDLHGAESRDAKPADVEAFLSLVDSATVQTFPAVGEGVDLRLNGDGISGAALRARDRMVHISAFRQERFDDGHAGNPPTRISRASHRMRL